MNGHLADSETILIGLVAQWQSAAGDAQRLDVGSNPNGAAIFQEPIRGRRHRNSAVRSGQRRNHPVNPNDWQIERDSAGFTTRRIIRGSWEAGGLAAAFADDAPASPGFPAPRGM